MGLNLVQHRGERNVWDRPDQGPRDLERWLVAITAGGLLVTAMRRRSVEGLLLAAAAGTLAWWAASGLDERHVRRARFTAWARRRAGDPVQEAAEESFPASDAPSWTPTTGSSTPTGGQAKAH